MDGTEALEADRARLVAIATRVLGDRGEAEDVVQQTWLRWHASEAVVEDLSAWLTTVTTRLCLDRLRRRIPVPDTSVLDGAVAVVPDPADEVVLADAVGSALQVVLDRLSPRERVAFVLHDSFAVEFSTIAAVLETTPAAARQLASRARTKIGRPAQEDHLADWAVVDAFMAAAREGDFSRLLQLLAPDVEVRADDAAVLLGTPARLDGRQAVATFFNGSAAAALPVFVADRPAAAWYHRGAAMVVFDLTVVDGVVDRLVFRADPPVLAQVTRRVGGTRRAGARHT